PVFRRGLARLASLVEAGLVKRDGQRAPACQSATAGRQRTLIHDIYWMLRSLQLLKRKPPAGLFKPLRGRTYGIVGR
ncbi:MAG: hypothetical protein KKB77_05855, partial [Bacteroidetes bacterium]|nr:hypothetical protein [Bacteroidota bacterium]